MDGDLLALQNDGELSGLVPSIHLKTMTIPNITHNYRRNVPETLLRNDPRIQFLPPPIL
jgi:hypothetical protein